ncbi:OmpA family protein [Sediminispirochaeta smaragdinae]|uniref:OmpA/MotB domain protein n=1 Tax=Sediminispirochaeta smaragdinae (strain DSM 11293 / JCM 15392 / SEBR 4228) TaxID=573413 RepID=E1R7Q2_SEDSS|nr:OmpA family protein [Sediminispirochaeta smaragdinae]ADK82757.1 OmpA/MotB domain protein [Sediminispirochaeta smaragdinae DSM 11293]
MKKEIAYIAIEIENTTLTRCMDLKDGKQSHTLQLTTMVDNQRRALVTIFLCEGSTKQLLKQFDLTHLRPKPAGPPRFFLTCLYDGNSLLTIRLKVDGKEYAAERVDLSRFIRRKRPMLLLIPVFLLLAAAAVLLIPRTCTSRKNTDRTVTASVSAEESRHSEESSPAATGKMTQEASETIETQQSPAKPSPQASSPPPTSPPQEQPQEQRKIAEQEPTAPVTASAFRSVEKRAVIYFHPNDSELTAEAQTQLRVFGRQLREWNSIDAVSIEGHCALLGTEKGRIELSRERAENSAAFLETIGIPAQGVSLQWFAGERPATRDPDKQELNRRVEISAKGKEERQ